MSKRKELYKQELLHVFGKHRKYINKENIDSILSDFDECRDFLNKLNYMDKKYLEKNKLKWVTTSQLYESNSKEHLRQVFYNTVMIPENMASLKNL